MEEYKYDENNELWYELQGDYYLPCLKLPEEKHQHIGIWGQRHHEYLRRNKRIILSSLQISGELTSYLADIDQQAEEMFERLVKQMAAAEGVTERLKSDNQMVWVRKTDNIRNLASEIVNNKIVFR